MGSYGLRTYIWNNRLKSVILLAGFPVLLLLICFAFALIFVGLEQPRCRQRPRRRPPASSPSLIPVALGGALVWFAIAWFANAAIVDAVTGARRVDRKDEPRLWNLLENLCISRGITMPGLRIIETDARNAFASGVRKSQYSITVTRGLMDALDDAELEAVLAHELTHIENRDVQLLVIAAVFVGIISLVGDHDHSRPAPPPLVEPLGRHAAVQRRLGGGSAARASAAAAAARARAAAASSSSSS